MSSHSGERDIESITNESDIDIRGRTSNGKSLNVPGNGPKYFCCNAFSAAEQIYIKPFNNFTNVCDTWR